MSSHCLDFVATYVGVLTGGKLTTSRVCSPSLKYLLVFVMTFTWIMMSYSCDDTNSALPKKSQPDVFVYAYFIQGSIQLFYFFS